jgi:hypothetical protein
LAGTIVDLVREQGESLLGAFVVVQPGYVLHQLGVSHRVQLTRYGKPVAILMSMSAFQRIVGPRLSFWDAYQDFLRSHPLEQFGVEPDVFDNARETSPGREVQF